MTPEGCSHLFIAVLMGAASINAANAQVALAATQNPDGIYAVDITTQQGDCDKAYHWMISVSGGRVNSVGATPMAASGQISGRRVASCETHPNGLSMRSQRIARRRIDRNLQDKPIASDPHAMRDSSASMNRFSSTTSSWSWIGFSFIGPGALKGKTATRSTKCGCCAIPYCKRTA